MAVWSAFTSSYQAQTVRASKVRRRGAVAGKLVGSALGLLAGLATRGWRAFQPLLLSVAGFGLLCTAAFQVGLTWGLAASGVSLIALDWLADDEED